MRKFGKDITETWNFDHTIRFKFRGPSLIFQFSEGVNLNSPNSFNILNRILICK